MPTDGTTALSLASLLPIPLLPLPLPTGIPTTASIGTTSAIRRGRHETKKANNRSALKSLVVNLASQDAKFSPYFGNALVVLRERKCWIVAGHPGRDSAGKRDVSSRTPDDGKGESGSARAGKDDGGGDDDEETHPSHPFHGGFRPRAHDEAVWAEEGYLPPFAGLVSTIPPPSRSGPGEAPLLSWVYVDRETHEVRCGTRTESEGENHYMGPWGVDASPEDEMGGKKHSREGYLTFQNWEGFVVVEERVPATGEWGWGLYFDVDDDGLTSAGRAGSTVGGDKTPRMLEVVLSRRDVRDTSTEVVNEEALWGLKKDGWGIRERVGKKGTETSSQNGGVEVVKERKKKGEEGWIREEGETLSGEKDGQFEWSHLEHREEVED